MNNNDKTDRHANSDEDNINEENYTNGQYNTEQLIKVEEENKKMKSLIDRIYRDCDWFYNGD